MAQIGFPHSFVAPRHSIDLLAETPRIDSAPMRLDELTTVLDLACRSISAIRVNTAVLTRVVSHDPETVFPFRSGGEIRGGLGFLYLNDAGHDALLFDEIDFGDPDPALLAGPDEPPAAIYTWALLALGKAAVGIGNVASHFRTPRFRFADIYAIPSTWLGSRILPSLGFEQTPSYQRDLWVYRRLAMEECGSPASFHVAA